MTTRRHGRPRRGQALIELAILFPFFLLIIIGGIVDFGFAFNNFVTLQEIANSAAQYGAEGNGHDGVSALLIAQYATNKKPAWWTGTLTVNSVTTVDKADQDGTTYKVKVIRMTYLSPVYTPFYQTMFQGATGAPSIPLSVMAAYQVPTAASVR